MQEESREGKEREMEEEEERESERGKRVTKRREGGGRGERRMLVYNPDFHFFPNS